MNVIAEYIWIDGDGELRSKARTLDLCTIPSLENIPEWDYDGSSTKQAEGNISEVILHPQSIFNCPFRGDNNILVMCDTWKVTGEPLDNNYRHRAKQFFDQNLESKPWFGLEQEYFLWDRESNLPLGWPSQDGRCRQPKKQGKYYCGVGSGRVWGRNLVEKHYKFCLYAGIKISGVNSEVAIGQWEYQVGPVEGIFAADQLWVSRYILQRLAENENIEINLKPKPLQGDWNGSGCHTNYSTKLMREGDNNKTGLQYIEEAIQKLESRHIEHMTNYGTGNSARMTGEHETSSHNNFTWGVANRQASVRIPTRTHKDEKGYLEDRRPGSNIDPYIVTGLLFHTTILIPF